MKKCIFIAIAVLSISACDRISGVRTEAKLTEKADVQCIDRTLRRVEGVGEVLHHTDRNESYGILPHRGKVVSIIDQWAYGENQNAAVQVADDGVERSYFNGMQKMGQPWPAAQLDAFVPLMSVVNNAIEKNCGIPLRMIGRITRN
ncbi:MAG TPA: hypothetical protein VF503_27200 [Sphingobium sp.]|uniref:hypothetical protein n=1 Tax=Sphingobium sp. TaxID=1912891 RepID=UPI002ED2AF15